MNTSQDFMKTKPVLPLLLSMSVPVILTMLIQSLYNIIDSIWVTKIGTDALTAVSLAFPLQNAIMSFGVGTGIGVASIVSINLGAGNRKKADTAASMGMLLVFFHCLIFLLAGIFITKPFIRMFTKDPHIFKMAADYTGIVLCLSFGEIIQMYFEKLFQSVGRTKTTMFLTASGCLINMVLDPILIFGWFGLPALGVRGAAIATVIGQVGAMLLYILAYAKKDIGVSIHLRGSSVHTETIKNIYSIAIPSSLMLAMPSVLTGILNGLLAGLGSIYVAVFGLYFKLQTFINLPSCGVVQGMRPIISFNYGAGEKKRVHSVIRWSLLLTAVIMVIGTLAAVVFPYPVLKLFDADEALMAAGIPALRIIGLSFIFSTVSIITAGVFEALGRGRDSLMISLLRQLIIIVPVGFILSRFIGAAGIWIAFPVAEITTCLISIIRLRSIKELQ